MIGEYIERKLFVEKALLAIHYIGAVPYGERSGLVADVYDQMMRDFQLVPPITGKDSGLGELCSHQSNLNMAMTAQAVLALCPALRE